MKQSTETPRKKPSPWLTMGSTAAIAALMLSLSACTSKEPEEGVQPTPMATETFGSDFATATPSPSATSGANPTTIPTLPPDAVNSSALPSSVSEAEIKEMSKVATDFIRAYNSIESTDAKPTQWRERTAPFTTVEYQNELAAKFPDDARASGWDEFKKNNARQFAEISNVRVGIGKDYASGKVTMSANYLISVTSDVSDGTQVLGRHNKFVELAKVDGTWKVSSLRSIAGGGA